VDGLLFKSANLSSPLGIQICYTDKEKGQCPNHEVRNNMNTATSFFLLLTLCYYLTPAYGDTLREVELIDGSVIRAQVLSMDGKTYRLRSETLGEVEIPEFRVKAIRIPKTQSGTLQSQTTSSSPPPSQQQIEPIAADTNPTPPNSPPASIPSTGDLQHAFSQDPAAMSSILSMRDDPLVQSILNDDRLMQAIHSGNLGELINDPRIRALMSHPTIQNLSGQYGQ